MAYEKAEGVTPDELRKRMVGKLKINGYISGRVSDEEIANHAGLTPEEARQVLLDLVYSIPAEDFEGFREAQITVMI